MTCAVADCLEPARPRSPHCEAHYKRSQRGSRVAGAVRKHESRWATLVEAALKLAEASAENDDDFRRAEHRLRMAAARYGRTVGQRRAAHSVPRR